MNTGSWGYGTNLPLYDRVYRIDRVDLWHRLVQLCLVLLFAIGVWLPANASVAAPLAEIQQRGYLIVAVKDNLPPLGFRDATGQLVGLEIELAHQLAEDLLGDRTAVRLDPVLNVDRLPALLSGAVDLVIARVTATGARARLVNFSPPYYLDGTALLTRGPAIQRLSDLADAQIAVLQNSSTISVVRSLLPTATLVGMLSYADAIAALEAGEAAAFAADASVLTGWTQAHSQYHLLPQLISAEALCVVMPKGIQYSELRHRVNQAIGQRVENGWLQSQLQAWGLPQ